MGATYPDLYAAIGVHSGLAAGCAHDLPSALQAMKHGKHVGKSVLAQTIPLILFYGDHDSTVHPRNADRLIQQLKSEPVDLLVVGSHGHGLVRDLLFGQTVDKVRHGLSIAMLISRPVEEGSV